MLNGKFIGIKEKASVFELEQKIVLSVAQSVILKATALGVYYVKINGRRVGENYLAPGWTNYKKRYRCRNTPFLLTYARAKTR